MSINELVDHKIIKKSLLRIVPLLDSSSLDPFQQLEETDYLVFLLKSQ